MTDSKTISKDWLLPGAVCDAQSVTADWQPVAADLIDGVVVREAKTMARGTGALTELWRADWGVDDEPVRQVFQNTIEPGGYSAWHAHAVAIDRITVNLGQLTMVLYDARQTSQTFGRLNEFHLMAMRPTLVTIPPKVWHGVVNRTGVVASLVNMPDVAYTYEAPDHWRVPADSPDVPYRIV